MDDAGKITAWEDTAPFTFLNTDTSQPAVGNFAVLAALPAKKKFRLRWGVTRLTPTASVLRAIDDVVVQGAP